MDPRRFLLVFALSTLGLAAGCAGSRGKARWPDAPSPSADSSEPKLVSVAQGGPLVPVTLGPPVQIEYAPLIDSPGRRPKKPENLTLYWPLPATGVTSMYGRRVDPLDGQVRFHRGIDLEADYGTVVKASARGQVVAAGWNGGYGRQIVLEHPGGFQTVYAHLSQILVPLGSYVDESQPIGAVGTSGRSTGAHLHFEVTQWNRHLDPLDILGVEMKLR
ncbi:MAG: M23 family metallopeptidase [Myxococcota bacterium]